MNSQIAIITNNQDAYNDNVTTQFNFQMAREMNMSISEFIINSIYSMLPYMDGPGSDHFII